LDKNKCPKKCPENTLTEKILQLDKFFLWSRFKPNIQNFVMIFFEKKNLKGFLYFHILRRMLKKNPLKSPKIFECLVCEYYTSNKKDFNKHLSTRKHTDRTTGTTSQSFGNPKNPDVRTFSCACLKEYTTASGLWKHKQKCDFDKNKQSEEIPMSNIITPELVMNIIKEYKNLANELVVEQRNFFAEHNKLFLDMTKNALCQNINMPNINMQNVNNNNKTFNLQFFLNETCKDAMNITDFVDSLQLQLSDLENVGKYGFVEGISNIIVKNLQALDVHKRPVHCADKKREIIYIKDENKWEKEDENKNKIRKAIKRVAFKNQKLLTKFKEEHPGCNFSHSKYADQYSKIVIEAMGGEGDNDTEKEDKIIKNIVKEVVIDKSICNS